MNFGLVLSTAFMVGCDSAAAYPFQAAHCDNETEKYEADFYLYFIDVERSLHRRRFSLSDRRCPQWFHGTGLSTRRPAPPMEPRAIYRNLSW